MIAFAYGLAALGGVDIAGWLTGLKVAAVAVVARAVLTMARNLCPDRARATLAVAAAIGVLAWPGPLGQLGAILIGGLIGWRMLGNDGDDKPAKTVLPGGRGVALVSLALFVALLLGLPVLAQFVPSQTLAQIDAFYRSGALVFGGGAAELTLVNPISADLDVMRPGLIPNLVDAIRRNQARGMNDAALFEVGPQYADDTPDGQSLVAAGARAGNAASRHWAAPMRPVDGFDAKADALAALAAAAAPTASLQVTSEAPPWYHPGRSGTLGLGPNVLATFGELHPAIVRTMDTDGRWRCSKCSSMGCPSPSPGQARPGSCCGCRPSRRWCATSPSWSTAMWRSARRCARHMAPTNR